MNETEEQKRLKVVYYDIVYSDDLGMLQLEVNKEIQNGFEPFGGITIDTTVKPPRYLQPIVKWEVACL